VKVLEKQRAELMEGFRKQLKLIDILKRQKVILLQTFVMLMGTDAMVFHMCRFTWKPRACWPSQKMSS